VRHTEIESLNKHLFEQSFFGVDVQCCGYVSTVIFVWIARIYHHTLIDLRIVLPVQNIYELLKQLDIKHLNLKS
jgi:hypothetical protein